MGPRSSGEKVVATNRRARRDYEILDSWECGIMLQGSEVKSLRESKVQLADSYARLQGDEVWLISLHIAPYSHSQGHTGHDPVRRRKLLLHRREIDRIANKLRHERLSIIAMRMYFKDGHAKVELGMGKGKKNYDKRQDLAKRDADRDAARIDRIERTVAGLQADQVAVDLVVAQYPLPLAGWDVRDGRRDAVHAAEAEGFEGRFDQCLPFVHQGAYMTVDPVRANDHGPCVFTSVFELDGHFARFRRVS